jgi:hypothetical protein
MQEIRNKGFFMWNSGKLEPKQSEFGSWRPVGRSALQQNIIRFIRAIRGQDQGIFPDFLSST